MLLRGEQGFISASCFTPLVLGRLACFNLRPVPNHYTVLKT